MRDWYLQFHSSMKIHNEFSVISFNSYDTATIEKILSEAFRIEIDLI